MMIAYNNRDHGEKSERNWSGRKIQGEVLTKL
jgi:hypothetical protein